jgi:putative nucleotidyltransferase with HDIG domain
LQHVPESIADAIQSAHLPSMPQVLLRFLRLAEEGRVSALELAEVVGLDPALSAQVLIAANAAALRRGRELKTLDQCLAALGPALVRTMASCLAIRTVFARSAEEQHYDLTGFWRHSLLVAELAGAIANRLERDDAGEVRLAGLLHDIGQLLLLGGLDGRYGALLSWSRDEEALIALETAELGCEHAAVGAWLVDQWRLSSFMADAVLFHHCPASEIAGADPMSRIVWAAHAASGWPVAAEGAPSKNRQFEVAAIETMLGLPANSLLDLHRQAAERVAGMAADFGIDVSANPPALPRSPQAPFENGRPADQRDAGAQIETAVRDMAIMQPLQRGWSDADNEDAAIQAIRESARIFFGLGRMAVLLASDDGPSLAGAGAAGQPELLRHLRIRIRAGDSLAAKAALGDAPQASFDLAPGAATPLADVQVARALGTEGVLYLPMRGREQLVGVMAFGLTRVQYAHCRSRLAWLARFAGLAAASIETMRGIRARERRVEAELSGRFERQARQAVSEAGNPLAIITNYLKIVAECLPDASGVRQELDILQEEIDRVAQIVQEFGRRAAAGDEDGPPR